MANNDKNNIPTMFNKNTYTIYRNHPTRRAAMILCALLVTLLPGKADTPEEIGGAAFPTTVTYTIKSASGYQLYAASEDANSLSAFKTDNVQTDSKYLFAFVPTTSDGTTTYYLYSVYAKKFVTSVSGSTTAYLYDGNIAAMTPVYVYKPANNNANNTDVYQYAIAFGNAAVSFPSSTEGFSNTTNNTNHVLQISGETPAITDWNYLGSGGNYSLQISPVSTAPFSTEALAEAQSSMKAYEQTENPFGTETGQLTTNSKVYTLFAENGSYLSATSSGLGGSTSAGANEQFLFFAKPATTGSAKGEGGVRRADGATEVYLYSVGQKKFLTASRGWTASSTDAAPIHVFSTNDAHGYSLAFSTNGTWATDGATIGTDNATTSAPSEANRFQALEAATADATRTLGQASTVYNGYYERATEQYLTDHNIDFSNVYAITSKTGTVTICMDGNSKFNFFSGQEYSNLDDSQQKTSQFAFVSDKDVDGNIYLYNISGSKAAKDDASFVTGEANIQPVYLYATYDATYPLAFSFSPTWNASNAKNLDGSKNNDTERMISGDATIGDNKLFKLTCVTDVTYVLSDARATLRGYYTPSTFSATEDGTKLVTDNKVYTLKSKAGKTLYANEYGQGLSVKTTSAADDGNVLAQFVFYQDPTAGSTNVYLYSVGRGQFVTSANGFDKSAPQSAIHVFDTGNTSYPYAFGFADTWTGGSVINAGSTLTFTASSPLDANRFMATDVTTASPYVVGEAKDIYDGVYAVSSLEHLPCDITDQNKRIASNKVYYMYTDKGKRTSTATNENHTALYHSSTNGMDKMASVYEGVGTERNKGIEYWKNDRNGHFAFVIYNDHLYFYSVNASKAVSSSGSLVSGESLQPVYVYETHDREFPLALSFSSSGWAETNAATINGNGSKDVSTDNALSAFNRFKLLEVDDDSYSLATARKYLALPNDVDEVITTDFHYKGVHGRDFKKRGTGNNDMQDVAEVHYYYYVDPSKSYGYSNDLAHAIDLKLPLYNYISTYPNTDGYKSNDGNDQEPYGYYRWYDYNTDAMPSDGKLVRWPGSSVSKLKDIASMDADNVKDLGWIGYNMKWANNGPNVRTVGVLYKIPQDADWAGDIIACDVSRYTDYSIDRITEGEDKGKGIYPENGQGYSQYVLDADNNYRATGTQRTDNTGYAFRHEPTLSIRYVFHILPAKQIADAVMNGLLQTGTGHALTMNDKGILVFGMKDPNATMNLRTDLTDPAYYYFHPLTGEAKGKNHHVYYNEADGDKYKYKEGDFDKDKLVQATGFTWRVYAQDPKTHEWYWRTFRSTDVARSFAICLGDPTTDDRGVDADVNRLTDTNKNGSFYHPLDQYEDNWPSTTPYTKTADLIQSPGTCYIVGYLVNETDSVPFFNAELQMNSTNYPKSDTQISEDKNNERTLSHLQDLYGSPVVSFTFDNENDKQTLNPPTANSGGHAVNTGDANMTDDNVSVVPSEFSWRQFSFIYPQLGRYANNKNTYKTRFTPLHGDFSLYKSWGTSIYDRTHAADGTQYGYFLYTDASNESRLLGHQDFIGSFCSGSQIIITAYVADMTSTNVGYDRPEVRLNLYGVTKDAEDNDVSTKLFASLCSGKFDNNIKSWDNTASNNVWYQVFGVVTLPANSGVENYTDFRIGIDNYCNSTNGADYAIDDIRVYQKNAKLTVVQIPALCDDESRPNIKVKGAYSTLKQLADVTTADKPVYYRFVNTDGAVVKGVYGGSNEEYGTVTIPYEKTTANADRFEFNTTINQDELVLANDDFDLPHDGSYYVSLAFDDNGKPGTWGHPSDICSTYSGVFSFVDERPVAFIDGKETSSLQVSVDCNNTDNKATSYSAISLKVTAPDKVNGGTLYLENIPFDWYLRGDANGTPLQNVHETIGGTEVYLQAAMDHFRKAYPEVSDNATAKASAAKDSYTAEEKTLLDKYIDNARVWLSNSNSLSGFGIPEGSQTIEALPTVSDVDVNGVTYTLCGTPLAITIRSSRNGTGLDLGLSDVLYPQSLAYRTIRLGLPQLRKMGAYGNGKDGTGEGGTLCVPVIHRKYENSETHKLENQDGIALRFINNNDPSKDEHPEYLYISDTNDPTIDLQNTSANKIAEIVYNQTAGGYVLDPVTTDAEGNITQNPTLDLCNFNTDLLHEGYWYEIGFRFKKNQVKEEDGSFDETAFGKECEGNTYLILDIVPEYLTWNPTADNGMNTNWNNDANWMRSTAAELYDPSYKDYREASYQFQLFGSNGEKIGDTQRNTDVDNAEKLVGSTQPNSYVPMYFSKVTIPALSNRPYPMLGYIRHNETTQLVLEMTNGKNHQPTTNIEYDMMATPRTGTSETVYDCTDFDGNRCEQIQFKPGAELRNQQYLHYGMAWVEMEMPVNEWGTLTTPMKNLLAGDLYVPKSSARQTTPSFKPVTFGDIDAVDANGKPWVSEDVSGSDKYGLLGKAGLSPYSRLRMPVYQKLWGKEANEYNGDTQTSTWTASDNPSYLLIYPEVAGGDNLNLQNGETYNQQRNGWSHVFNAVGYTSTTSYSHPEVYGRYNTGIGLAMKVGDDYATPSKETTDGWHGKTALVRLPKADTKFIFKKYDGSATEKETDDDKVVLDVSAFRTDNYRLGVDSSFVENAIGAVSLDASSMQPEDIKQTDLDPDNGLPLVNAGDSLGQRYDLIGNPYVSTIRMKDFIDYNKDVMAQVQREVTGQDANGEAVKETRWVYRIWILKNSVLYEYDPSNVNNVVKPGEAFFVKVKNPGVYPYRFTTRMQTDPTLSTPLEDLERESAGAKAYFITEPTDIGKAIEEGTLGNGMRACSPAPGWIGIVNDDAGRAGRARIYTVDGRMVCALDCAAASMTRHYTGSGIFVVRMTTADGKTEVRKMAVR